MRWRQSGPLPQAAHAGWSLASNSGAPFWIWTLNSGVQQPHTGYYREMIYMENWLWKHHLPLIFTSSSWVKTGPPGIGSIKVHLATRRMSCAPRQHRSVTPKSHRTKIMLVWGRGSVEPSDASAEQGCPRRGSRLRLPRAGPLLSHMLLSITFYPFQVQEAQGPDQRCSTWSTWRVGAVDGAGLSIA